MSNAVINVTIAAAWFMAIPAVRAQQTLDLSGIRFWVERADAVRGPEGYGEDNYYTSYQIAPGRFRNFTSNACWLAADGPNCTQAMDGTAVADASAPPTSAAPHSTPPEDGLYHIDVLHSTAATAAWAPCGQWLNSVLRYKDTLYGFVHGEAPQLGTTGCGISRTHHKTMVLWTSPVGANAGLERSWSSATLIYDSDNGDTGNGESGEGDCTAIRDPTYAYMFCRNPVSNTTTLARAPLTDLTHFIKYNNGWGSQRGLNGRDSDIFGTIAGPSPDAGKTSSALGSGASVWEDKQMVMLLAASDPKFVGLKTSFTGLSNLRSGSIGFTTLPDPLFVQETASSGRYPYGSNPPHYLYIYPSVLSPVDGTRSWDLTKKNQFLLAYAFVPPHNTLSHRLLAMRSVTVSKSSTAQDPQVLVALTTRYDPTYKQSYSSTQPVAYGVDTFFSYVPGTYSQIAVDTVGYLAQLPQDHPISQGQTLTKIVECRSSIPWPSGHPDHLVTMVNCDSNYNEETVAGYSYPRKPATGSSVQIYRCSSSANQTHWVSTSNTCYGAGSAEKSLGWILTK
jgi:hypothetical protein